jgi:hypothetical protein
METSIPFPVKEPLDDSSFCNVNSQSQKQKWILKLWLGKYVRKK